MKKSAIFVSGLAVISALGFAGYRINHEIKCANMEEDLLNSFSELKLAISAQSLGDKELDQFAERMKKESRAKSDNLLSQISDECGSRKADTALRKIRDMSII